jgi:predicted HicB family RNase H-like nuclease
MKKVVDIKSLKHGYPSYYDRITFDDGYEVIRETFVLVGDTYHNDNGVEIKLAPEYHYALDHYYHEERRKRIEQESAKNQKYIAKLVAWNKITLQEKFIGFFTGKYPW